MFRPMMAIIGRQPTLQRKCFTYITCMLSCMGYTSTGVGEQGKITPNGVKMKILGVMKAQ
jgi:hypothetical protein